MFVEFRLGGTSVWRLGSGSGRREVGIVRPANCYQSGQAEALLGPANRGEAAWLLEYELIHGDVLGFPEWRELLLRFDSGTRRVHEVTFFD